MISHVYLISSTDSRNVYVGKTHLSLERRFKQHRNAALNPDGPDWRSTRWLKKHINSATISLLETCSPEQVSSTEKRWIAHFRRELGRELVLNMTDGGEGLTSEGMKDIWRRPGYRDRLKTVLTRAQAEPETKAKSMGLTLDRCLSLRDRVLALNMNGLSSRRIAREVGTGKGTVLHIIKGTHWTSSLEVVA